jgi:acetoin utilization protein AcuB
MQTTPITVTPEDLVSTAYQRMHSNRIRHLPVVEGTDTLVGVITDRDIRRVSKSDEPHMAVHELTYLLEKLTVQETMTSQVLTVRGDTPVIVASQILLEKKFGCLPVVRDDNTLEGIITVTDLLRLYVKHHEAAGASEGSVRRVRAMLQKAVVTATPNTSLAQAQRLMQEKRIRHLPVVSGKGVVGIVTDRDIREAAPSPATALSRGEIAYQMDTTPVETCMTKDVVCISPDMDMVQAVRLLLERKIGCLPVVEEGALVGMVTEIDCLQAFLSSGNV